MLDITSQWEERMENYNAMPCLCIAMLDESEDGNFLMLAPRFMTPATAEKIVRVILAQMEAGEVRQAPPPEKG